MPATGIKPPTVVLVPGAWHVPAHYSELSQNLEREGYVVHCPHLPSTSENPTTENHDEDVALVRSIIQSACDSGEDVLLVTHSAGGIIGSEAAKGLLKTDLQREGREGGIVHVVYIAAFAAPIGLSVFAASGGPSPWVVMEDPACTFTNPQHVFYNTCSPEQTAKAVKLLQRHSTGCMWSPATYEVWKDVEGTYLLCELDNAIPPEAQEGMISQQGARFGRVERVRAGHAVMFEMPEFCARVVRRAAGEDV